MNAGGGRLWDEGGAHPQPLYLLDVPTVSCSLGHDHAEGVEDEAGQPQQLHAVANEGRGDDIVHKEGALVGQEDAPGEPPGVRAERPERERGP